MPEPFKNFFNRPLIKEMSLHLHRADPSFRRQAFVNRASKDLDSLELKERSNQILTALKTTLPDDYRQACQIILKSLAPETNNDSNQLGIDGWAIMPVADFVADRGLDDFDFSLEVLKELTKRFSAEFAIRHFLVRDARRALKTLKRWASDPNVHVRRLVSEGSRPRLPWGIRLHMFVEDPRPMLPILKLLRDDSEEYVRRSVANHLNDIAKDHPELIAGLAADWLEKASKNRQRLIAHACRTLVKQGHQPTLKALGFGQPKVTVGAIEMPKEKVLMGGNLDFAVDIQSKGSQTQPLIIDYVIHHLKANGQRSPKVFKWKKVDLDAGAALRLTKRHSFKPITTRVYYPGTHQVEVQINGKSYGTSSFELRSS